jgi:tetratricopeptide (TPR) repeat protein
VREFKRDIENFQAGLPVSARRDNAIQRLLKWGRRNPTRAAVFTLALCVILLGGAVTMAVRAKVAEDRAELEQAASESRRREADEARRRADAETSARRQAQALEREAARTAELERDKAESQRKEAERLQARRNALVPYSTAADLRQRSATISDWSRRAEAWRAAIEHYRQAIDLDPSFAQAQLELAQTYADLGLDSEALEHFARADQLTAEETGRGHVEALMSYAMFDFQRKALSETNTALVYDELFKRIRPVREAALPGSNFAKLADILLDLGESYRNSDGLASRFVDDLEQAASKLRLLEKEGPVLWEVYTMLAIFDFRGTRQTRDADISPNPLKRKRAYLEKARELKPNLPLLAWIETNSLTPAEKAQAPLAVWDAFIQRFPYDPRGYFGRAMARLELRSDDAGEQALNDLDRALENNRRYEEANRLVLNLYARKGDISAARRHIETMRLDSRGLEAPVIHLMEAELMAAIGDHERLRGLLAAALKESSVDGQAALGRAALVLLRNHDFKALVPLCEFLETVDPGARRLCDLLRARALTMLGRIDEADLVFTSLAGHEMQLPADWRPVLKVWTEACRRYPAILSNLTSLPDARDRLDIARLLACAGQGYSQWLWIYEARSAIMERGVLRMLVPADGILLAIGTMQKLRLETALSQRERERLRESAVNALISAFDEGYVNRRRVRDEPELAPLLKDPRIARYFVER